MKKRSIYIVNTKLFFSISILLFPLLLIAQERLPSKSQLPILGWYSIPPGDQTNVARYLEMKEAGFSISYSFLKSIKDVEQALTAAEIAGMKIVIKCPELRTETEKTVKKFMNHPALAGYFIQDEPTVNEFDSLEILVKRINAIDSKHFCYINLFPNYVYTKTLGDVDYKTYINRFINNVPMHFYSFDSYPLSDIRNDYADWYKNLEVFSSEVHKAGKTFWAFVQSTQFDDRHEPTTLATLRVQIYTNLAYGAQGIQYFTYWTPPANNGESFYDGPIGLDGKRTSTFDKVKQLNQELINLSGVFVGSKVISIQQTGKNIPTETVRMVTPPFPIKVLETTGNGALVSVLEKGNYRFIIIVNRDYKKSMNLILLADDSLKKVLKDGSIVPANSYSTNLEIESGDAVIYMCQKQ